MTIGGIASEILGLYRKHGWEVRRVLFKPENREQVAAPNLFADAKLIESSIDAVWFARPSRDGEAWELRLLSEQPFALFEKFEKDETEEEREEVRTEMEAKMRDYLTKPSPS